MDAYRFVDWLHDSGISVWQMLPVGPTHEDRSPYQCLSVHAGNPLLIDIQEVADQSWCRDTALPKHFHAASREQFLRDAFEEWRKHASDAQRNDYRIFQKRHSDWLPDYALYMAIRTEQEGRAWSEWPAPLRLRQAKALDQARQRLERQQDYYCFEQFTFYRQLLALKKYAREKDVWLFGDIPIFVAYDSADVWANPEIFDLDESGAPLFVAGVPPDYFSKTGQRWGNPLYRWDVLQQDDFNWWKQRIHTQMDFYDLIRIDHFRGFEAYWKIEADAETAIDGTWEKAPGTALFDALVDEFGTLPLVAEDLGVITREVEKLRDHYRLPGMKILQFAFGGEADNPYLPHNHAANMVVYTGTHDNDTTVGWYQSLDASARQHILDYLGQPNEAMPWPLLRAAFASVAVLALAPMQDFLELDSQHRMNIPGTTEGNWQWRFDWGQVPESLSSKICHMVRLYDRETTT
jgi:4-alpha-glucanotransferase